MEEEISKEICSGIKEVYDEVEEDVSCRLFTVSVLLFEMNNLIIFVLIFVFVLPQ